VPVVDVGPQLELLPPLLHRHTADKNHRTLGTYTMFTRCSANDTREGNDVRRCTEDDSGLLDGAACGDSDQSLARTARQYDDTRPRSPDDQGDAQ
jgi:hypothetical protein